MLPSSAFQVNKLRRAISTIGETFVFIRPGENAYGEPTGVSIQYAVPGIWFESTESYNFERTSSQGTTVYRKPQPNVLCIWKDASSVRTGDTLKHNNKQYTVTVVKDVNEGHAIGNIALEAVQDIGV